mgnify:CR=1 FL=1
MSHPTELPILRLKRDEDRRLSAGHLWVFSNEVNTTETPLTAFKAGDLCQVRSQRDKFMGYAYVNPSALICARILGRDERHPPGDKSLLVHRLQVALSLRARVLPQCQNSPSLGGPPYLCHFLMRWIRIRRPMPRS